MGVQVLSSQEQGWQELPLDIPQLSSWENERLLLRATYIQYTPLWPGGPNNETFMITSNNILTPVTPSPNHIVGKARYLMRIAQISQANGYPKTHMEADGIVSEIFGSTERASILQVRAWYEPTGEVHSPHYITMRQAGRIIGLGSCHGVRGVFEAWQIAAYHRLRGLLNINDNIQIDDSRIERNMRCISRVIGHDDEAMLLMAIPRIYLQLSSTSSPQELAGKQPIRAGYYKLTLEAKLRRPSHNVDPGQLALALASLALVPQILGLGKATNRGLGRFRLEDYTLGPGLDRLGTSSIIDRILGPLASRAPDPHRIREALREYLRLADDIARRSYEAHRGQERTSDPVAPSLLDSHLMYTHNPVHPCPYATRELSRAAQNGLCGRHYACSVIGNEGLRTLCILSAIGASTLKSVWKACRRRRIKDPGPGYHTWILGLPRKVRNTGYSIVEGVSRRDDINGEVRDRVPGSVRDVRHQSMFNLFPLPEGSLVMIHTPSPGSLARILEHQGRALWHAGKHGQTLHWSKVSHVATSRLSRMFRDEFGIATPMGNRPSAGGSRGIVDDATGAAVQWLSRLLRLHDSGRIHRVQGP